jgi:hypothetical protein
MTSPMTKPPLYGKYPWPVYMYAARVIYFRSHGLDLNPDTWDIIAKQIVDMVDNQGLVQIEYQDSLLTMFDPIISIGSEFR